MAVTPLSPAPVAPTGPDNGATIARLWVAHGMLWLAFIAYSWGGWILGGDFEMNTTGRGEEPDWFFWLVRAVEVFIGIFFTGWIIWRFIIKPKIQTGRFTFDALFFLACWLMFFQEPFMNWFNLQFLYATTFVNFGFWGPSTPGWGMPNAEHIPVPLVYGMAYLWMLGFGAWAASKYMAYQRRKFPERGNGRLIWQTFAVICIIDFVVENIMVRLQLINYPRTIPELTLWAGTDHQFPMYEVLAWSGTFLGLACLHHFRDDQGRSWPERGIDKLKIKSERLQTFCRFAAIAGFAQLCILFAFNLPYQVYGLHADEVAEPYLERPWRMGGVCGPDTGYHCGGPGIPMPRSDTPPGVIGPDFDPETFSYPVAEQSADEDSTDEK